MKKLITRLLFLGLPLFSATILFNSCVNNDDLSITEPTRYTSEDLKSYSDMFDIFWTTMDQRYNYFYEQKRKDGMDWDEIYKEYSPKFKALKTFGRTTENDKEIYDDYLRAVQYFDEIIDPIIDKHFSLTISFPVTNNDKRENVNFKGGKLTENPVSYYIFSSKYFYMQNRVAPNSFISDQFAIGGYLNSNPDIYYFTFEDFSLTEKFKIELKEKYLSPNEGNGLLLTTNVIDNSVALNSIPDPEVRKRVRDFTLNILNDWNEYFKSEEIVKFNSEVEKFNTTEVVSNEFVTVTNNAVSKSGELVDFLDISTYAPIFEPETFLYINWFIGQMSNHVRTAYNFDAFKEDSEKILTRAPFYIQFLNPLHKGEVKKLILDLRDNKGGALDDARFFSDRFITKNEIYGYQRLKEGNGRFNYTPWVPSRTVLHQFGIPNNIPITVLTDKESMSMAEITTMMLKSQGNHVISIGDYSKGGTAGLGPFDDFNSGIRDVVAGRLTFTVPLMAFKDAKGVVIEGVGIKPDIYVTQPTDDEQTEMFINPDTFVDRVMVEAIKYLSSK